METINQNCTKHILVGLYAIFLLYVIFSGHLDKLDTRFLPNGVIKYIIISLMLVIMYVLLLINFDDENNDVEDYINTQDNSFQTRRQQKIKELNDGRNTEGRFYVNCHKCGRDRILDDRFNNLKRRELEQKEMCIKPCTNTPEKSMSFYNENYVDSSKIFCYNCLIDEDEKNSSRIQTYGDPYADFKSFRIRDLKGTYAKPYDSLYVYWPTLNDPVNGPPYV